MEAWLKVFFEDRFKVIPSQDRVEYEHSVIEEGGQFEGPNLILREISQSKNTLNKLTDAGIVRTRVRLDTPGVLQYHAGDIVKYLKKQIKLDHNQMLLIFTDADLFPRDGWSFGKFQILTLS